MLNVANDVRYVLVWTCVGCDFRSLSKLKLRIEEGEKFQYIQSIYAGLKWAGYFL